MQHLGLGLEARKHSPKEKATRSLEGTSGEGSGMPFRSSKTFRRICSGPSLEVRKGQMTSGDPLGTASWNPQGTVKQGLRVSALGCPANVTFETTSVSSQGRAWPSSAPAWGLHAGCRGLQKSQRGKGWARGLPAKRGPICLLSREVRTCGWGPQTWL